MSKSVSRIWTYIVPMIAALIALYGVILNGRTEKELAKLSRMHNLATARFDKIVEFHNELSRIPEPPFEKWEQAVADPRAAPALHEAFATDFLNIRALAYRYRPYFDDDVFGPAVILQDSIQTMINQRAEFQLKFLQTQRSLAEMAPHMKIELTEKVDMELGNKLIVAQIAFREALEDVKERQLERLKAQQSQ